MSAAVLKQMQQAGWARTEIALEPDGYAMFGYGMWHHRARGTQTALFARAVCIGDGRRTLILSCADLGYISHAVRRAVCTALQQQLGPAFDEALLVLTCTHTHSGPGGCSHEAFYNIVTPGFVTRHLQVIVTAIMSAVVAAWNSSAPTELKLYQAPFGAQVEVAWNRSLRAYNRNPDVVRRADSERHLAMDRTMQVIAFRRAGRVRALLSLFGVHATCLGNTLERYDADNKGYAAVHAEQVLRDAGQADAVAIFAQATAGDISPHYHGPGDWARRTALQGAAEYAYAERNGHMQSTRALSILDELPGVAIEGEIDGILSYADFTAIQADPRFANGKRDAWTSEPCYGVAFFIGTPVDGRGMPPLAATVSRAIAKSLRGWRLSGLARSAREMPEYDRRLYAAQDPKAILLDAGRKTILGQPLARLAVPGFLDPTIAELKRQARVGAMDESPLLPTVLPLQIVSIGPIALLCCPGEFSTTAGARLVQSVQACLQARGTRQVLICTYCNDYMGYVTTQEEYQEQAFEGGATIFGKWTLAAFQTRFDSLARAMLMPDAERRYDRTTRPPGVPPGELAKRSDIPVPR